MALLAVVAGAMGCGASVDATPGTESSSSTGSTGQPTPVDTTSESTGTPPVGTSSSEGTTTPPPMDTGNTESTGSPVQFDVAGAPDLPVLDTTTGVIEPIDCEGIPSGPLPYTIKNNIRATEDLAFDDQGNLVGADGGALFRTQYDGNPQLWVPNSQVAAGLRATSEGMFVYNGADNLSRINEVDAPEVILGGLSYPNGMDVDLDGHVYVAEQSGSRVRRINSETGEFTVLAEGLQAPNGVSFSPDYRTLYVGSFGGGTITAISLSEEMETESVDLFYSGVGGGALDGMAVDACGNVYVCEYIAAVVWRITPDGESAEQLIQLGAETGWIPNLQWGSGFGGWDDHTLYVLDFSADRVFEVPVGVPDKPRGYP